MASSSSTPNTPSSGKPASTSSRARWVRRWIALGLVVIFLVFIMREVLNPYGDQPYTEIPHGDHVHYVPKDRDPDVPIGDFPTQPPGEGEQITPDGRIVPMQ